jgi:hypothetical protein
VKQPVHRPIKSTAVNIKPSGPARQYSTPENRITFVPLSIKRRQQRTLLIAPQAEGRGISAVQTSPAAAVSFDLPLIRTLGKAYHWQKLLDSGEVSTIAALADRLVLHQGWVAEVLRMTRLAPDIVQAILSGTQPRHLNLHALRGRQAVVSLDWDEQRRVFGLKAR